MIRKHSWRTLAVASLAMCGGAAAAQQADNTLQLVTGRGACATPPPLHCPDTGCSAATVYNPGQVVELKTRRTYFLDYPCDLKKGEDVVLVLNLHGAGSWGNWQRHYFPAFDYVNGVSGQRMIVATPNAPTGTWTAIDDEYLHNVVDYVVGSIGKENIKSFWLAGHSQGGLTSRRIVCDDYFKDKVDGWISLSGGRLGQQTVDAPPRAAGAQGGGPAQGAPAARAAPRPSPTAGAIPACDYSFIYAIGELEMGGGKIPPTSPVADRYGCSTKGARQTVVDEKAGYVTGSSEDARKTLAPGSATVDVFPKCKDGRVVADVVRLAKGHTNGLEPKVTEQLVKLIVSAPGGKIAKGAWTPPAPPPPPARGARPGGPPAGAAPAAAPPTGN
jgi:hypothetical protein